MTLEQLRIFITVAETLNMRRASELLHLTQPAVSAAIGALEARHGTRLLDRVGRRLELNAAGRAFLPEAHGVLARAEGARRVLEEHERMRLTGADAAAFLDAVAAPPKPAERLVKALQKHQSIAG